MAETDETAQHSEPNPPPSPPEPPATEEEIVELDNYFEKGLRTPSQD